MNGHAKEPILHFRRTINFPDTEVTEIYKENKLSLHCHQQRNLMGKWTYICTWCILTKYQTMFHY